LITELAICQKSYVPVSIIDLKGDTIKDLGDYQNWERNPKKINFT